MSNIVVPSSPADRKVLKERIQEIAGALDRIDAEKDLIKNIKASIKDEFELPPKLVTTLAKSYNQQNYDEVVKELQAQAEDIQEAFELLLK
jgi:F0F1-type ATP synthase membrane subunit b/b'